jgi:hypothetical protein
VYVGICEFLFYVLFFTNAFECMFPPIKRIQASKPFVQACVLKCLCVMQKKPSITFKYFEGFVQVFNPQVSRIYIILDV